MFPKPNEKQVLMFNVFEITVDSRADVRNNIERSFVPLTQFPPMVTSCQTVIGYWNRDIVINTVRVQSISITMKSPHVVLLKPHSLCSHPPPHQPLAATDLFIFLVLSFQEWNHTACELWGLVFFTQHNSLESHPVYVHQ